MPALPIKRRTQTLGTADVVEISGEEAGFELYIGTDDGARYVVNIHSVLGSLLEEVTREITAYLDEGEAARATRPDRYVTNIDDNDRHSLHADLWDLRDKEAS